MSTPTTAIPPTIVDPVRFAKLVRGRTYFLLSTEYEFGKFVSVNAEDEAYLSENAVDEVSMEGEGESIFREKFKFYSLEEKNKEEGRDMLRQEAADEITQKRPLTSRQRTRA